MYSLCIKPDLDRRLQKLAKKNKHLYEIIRKKVGEIILNPQHYKNLRVPFHRFKRVNVNSHFVLIFSVDENAKTVTLEGFDHHDSIYQP